MWRNSKGREVIEEYRITGLSHGTPLDTRGSNHGEIAAPFMLEAGISSTRLISQFWSIVPDVPDEQRLIALAQPSGAAEGPTKATERLHWAGHAGVGKTIEDALRNAGLMK